MTAAPTAEAPADVAEDMSILEAIRAALIAEMERDERVGLYGINQAVMCGVVHVEPDDVAIADEPGICFVPVDGAEMTLHRIVEVAEEEKRLRRGI